MRNLLFMRLPKWIFTISFVPFMIALWVIPCLIVALTYPENDATKYFVFFWTFTFPLFIEDWFKASVRYYEGNRYE